MIIQSLIIIIIYFTLWYILAAIKKNAGLVDIGWGLGFVIIAFIGFVQNINLHTIIIFIIVAIWGLRLSIHIFKRNYGKDEDFRYANFRKEWGKNYYLRSYFQLFLFQALLTFVISLAFLYAYIGENIKSPVIFIIGIIIWIIGFIFESVGDKQLKKFISDPNNKGKIINVGLWNYTRHPNYFGEATMWWGIYVISIACGAPWLTIISPITITVMVRFVSGVPMLEKNLKKRVGFEEYIKTTNTFIPWFKRSSK